MDVLSYAIVADTKTVFLLSYLKSLCNGEEFHVLYIISEENPLAYTVLTTQKSSYMFTASLSIIKSAKWMLK